MRWSLKLLRNITAVTFMMVYAMPIYQTMGFYPFHHHHGLITFQNNKLRFNKDTLSAKVESQMEATRNQL